MSRMRVEASDEPTTSFLMLKHGIGDQHAVSANRSYLRNGVRPLNGQALNIGVENIAGLLSVLPQCQQIEGEKFFDLGHGEDG